MGSNGKVHIAIIGAGIAGLAAAISLKDHPGIDVQIYEQASELREVGASIALGPNGLRTLQRLGVDNALDESIAFRNKSGYPMIYRHWKTNEIVSTDSHRGYVDSHHYTARFYRPHLQQALLQCVDHSAIHLKKSFEAVKFDDTSKKVHITFVDGTTAAADILLGADGIHSPVRTSFVPTSKTAWTGGIAFRSVFDESHLSQVIDIPEEATHYWGPGRAFFASRLGGGLFTTVALCESDPRDPEATYNSSTWNMEADVNFLKKLYKDWSPEIRSIVGAIPYTNVYANVAAHGLDTWVLGRGNITLAGDAAHAHGGAFAAGGSLALDDSWAFGASIRHFFPREATKLPTSQEIVDALRLYEATRKAHTDKLIKVVHDGNKMKRQRLGKTESDDELRARMKNRADTSWIHEHDVVAAFKQAQDLLFSGQQARL
ncbi:Salicylate hydroxylase [Paramyrothecium foliicola]|nr:Salicylate hydroxylase [Paramyrothecium foliicola]